MSRRNKFKSIIGLGISTAGLFMILAAIGANLLGLDRDAGWGPARYFLLGCGSALALSPHITWIVKKIWSQDLLRPLSNWLIRFHSMSGELFCRHTAKEKSRYFPYNCDVVHGWSAYLDRKHWNLV